MTVGMRSRGYAWIALAIPSGDEGGCWFMRSKEAGKKAIFLVAKEEGAGCGSNDEWDLAGSSLRVRRRDREARWEHAERSSEEDHKTHRKNVRGY
ncbi:hypothetical protein B296_00013963 [Ensete ventricosum]|uniref:Uncharacterized protein n=1 Tax=Ensete ventricosum TaxID=4639 RepID=A0A426XSX4_ENSVE|nr:hypothetical protein B296_00013963 [Ensete ventricosum]